MEAYPDLTGKIALVTGASAGMGKAITQAYLAAGMTVIGTGRRSEKLAQLHALLPAEQQPRFIPSPAMSAKARTIKLCWQISLPASAVWMSWSITLASWME